MLLVDLFAPDADAEALRQQVWRWSRCRSSGAYFADRSQEIGMVEVDPARRLGAGRQDAGRVREFRTRYDLTVIGLRRGAAAHGSEPASSEELQVGDTLLVVGLWTRHPQAADATARDLIVLNLPAELDEVLPAAGKAPQALLCLLLVVGLMVSGVVPERAGGADRLPADGRCCGCVDFTSAYRSIHWKSLVLIVGMLPFSLALQRTGGVDLAADALIAVVGEAGAARRAGEPVRDHGASSACSSPTPPPRC